MSGATGLWDVDASYERVALEDLAVELQVGVNDWERTPGKAQRLLISVEMFRHRGEFTGSSLADCVDYGRVYRRVIERWTPDRAHVDLLESLVEELVAVCFEDAQIEACRIAIRKPHVYNGRAVPVVEVYRLRTDISSEDSPDSQQIAARGGQSSATKRLLKVAARRCPGSSGRSRS